MITPLAHLARRALAIAFGSLLVALSLPGVVLAHGVAPTPTSWADVLLAWSIEPHVIVPIFGLWLVYRLAVQRVNVAHPGNPVPRFRVWSWNLGLLVLVVALCSPIATYDTTLFSVHMVQHILLALVAAPLLAMGAPITLLLRVSSPRTRQKLILPVLHSWPLRVISFPVVTWVLFAAVMWASHFSALYDASLDNELVHIFEHALYLGVALLFWWPVVGADPSPWRMSHPARIGYVFLGMPQSSFLALAIISAPAVLYPHYETLVRTWGPTPLADQQLAGGIMWVVGDAIFLIAMIAAIWVWLRAEEREGARMDAKLDREDAARTARAAAHSGHPISTTAADAAGVPNDT